MKKINLYFSTILILVVNFAIPFAYAQQLPDSCLADFYPLNIGDVRQYKYVGPYESLLTKRVIGDTLLNNGKSYRIVKVEYGKQIIYDFLRFDSSTVYLYDAIPAREYIWYKFNEKVGEYWYTNRTGGSCDTTLLGRIDYIREMEIFGETKTEIRVSTFCASDTSYWLSDILVKGIGPYRLEGEGDYYLLQGTIINGKQYGVITSVTEHTPYSPNDIELLSNYPNPFNSSTTIRYSIKTTQKVEIAVYDILGRKVTVLFKGLRTPGIYFTAWDGTDSKNKPVASGTYIIFSKGQFFTESRLATLLK